MSELEPTSPDVLVAFFCHKLGRMIPKALRETFEADLARTNLELMAAALLKAEAIALIASRPMKDPRAVVLANYERIVGEISQLFPVFLTFESAWRSYVTQRLTVIYGGDDWWRELRDRLEAGLDTSQVGQLGTRPASFQKVKLVSYILENSSNRSDITTSTQLLQSASLKNLEDLIDLHWSDMSDGFSDMSLNSNLTSGGFRERFAVVRKARNDAYHHRTVSQRPKLLAAAEQLLDLLDMHLGARVEGIAKLDLPELSFNIVRTDRHS